MNQIIEGNKLIAEFMGGKLTNDINLRGMPIYEFPSPVPNELNNAGWRNKTKTGYIHYDISWDWLMPVVEKICEVCKPNSKEHFWWNNSNYSDIRIFREPLDITYKTVIEFIKWYNLTLNPETP